MDQHERQLRARAPCGPDARGYGDRYGEQGETAQERHQGAQLEGRQTGGHLVFAHAWTRSPIPRLRAVASCQDSAVYDNALRFLS